MRIGLCIPLEKSAPLKSAGWDFVEENVQSLLQAELPEPDWHGPARAKSSALPIYAANCMVPASLKITGPAANIEKLQLYMATVLRRAEKIGIKTLVLGSGGARQIPEGFDRRRGQIQLVEFGKMIAPQAAAHGVTIVLEHLNTGECNFVNSLNEAMTYVRAVNHPHFQLILDSFHFWESREDLSAIAAAAPWIKHVHLADRTSRRAPGESRQADYRPLFAILKHAGYDGALSVEATGITDVAAMAARVLSFIRGQWREA